MQNLLIGGNKEVAPTDWRVWIGVVIYWTHKIAGTYVMLYRGESTTSDWVLAPPSHRSLGIEVGPRVFFLEVNKSAHSKYVQSIHWWKSVGKFYVFTKHAVYPNAVVTLNRWCSQELNRLQRANRAIKSRWIMALIGLVLWASMTEIS